MARKPRDKSAATPEPNAEPAKPAAKPAAKPSGPPRERIVAALMRLAAERPWNDIGIPEIAAEAGVTLAEFRDLFPPRAPSSAPSRA